MAKSKEMEKRKREKVGQDMAENLCFPHFGLAIFYSTAYHWCYEALSAL
jgi:hypothetical protein